MKCSPGWNSCAGPDTHSRCLVHGCFTAPLHGPSVRWLRAQTLEAKHWLFSSPPGRPRAPPPDHRTTLSRTGAQPWSKDNNTSKNGFDRERDNRMFTVLREWDEGVNQRKKEAGGREDTFSSAVSSRVCPSVRSLSTHCIHHCHKK